VVKRTQRPSRDNEAGNERPCILIVDDEADILELLELTLLRMGLEADRAMSVGDALTSLKSKTYGLCLTDMRLPDGEGLQLVEYIAGHCPNTPVAVITAHGNTENAVAALKAGAFDYLSKPVSLEQLRVLVKSALNLAPPETTQEDQHQLLGKSPAIQGVREKIAKLARSQAAVYVTGESGSGKELAARLIHASSPRRDKPFVAVNCGAIPENLMESEFFGYRKGAFTGADHDREGFFQAANGGTLFLDEVADLPLAMQVKLLRAIQEKKVRKVGATQEDPVDVRIISATHQSLAACVESGKVRQDLYYRLNVIELRMPPLREMAEDVPVIAQAVLAKLAAESGLVETPRIAPEAFKALQDYCFPGNVRELENILERALALCGEANIGRDDLYLAPPQESGHACGENGNNLALPEYLDEIERQAIMEALAKARFNKTAAAKLLGITFRALRYRLERLGI